MEYTDIIRKPIVTEKSIKKVGQNQYTFEVAKRANKHQIKKAVEILFEVEVLRVRVLNRRGKIKKWRGKPLKKSPAALRRAIVAVRPDQKIKIFEEITAEEFSDNK